MSCSCILLQTELLDDTKSYGTFPPRYSKEGLQMCVKLLLKTTVRMIISNNNMADLRD